MRIQIKLKNIDELKQLIEQLETTVDKINNFQLQIETSQYEQNQDI